MDPGDQACAAAGVDDNTTKDAPPVLLEGGLFFFGRPSTALLRDHPQQVEGDRVLHLHYTVQR